MSLLIRDAIISSKILTKSKSKYLNDARCATQLFSFINNTCVQIENLILMKREKERNPVLFTRTMSTNVCIDFMKCSPET